MQQAMDDIAALFPEARGVQLVHSVVVKERRATFSSRPGLLARRSGPASPWPNLWWAGDWTQTPFPSTIEGACLSGKRAAEAVLKHGNS